MSITFNRLKAYLEAIADNAVADAANARHGRFWNTDYTSFMNGVVPTKQCNAQPVPIIDPTDKKKSAFYLILQASWCNMPQMPKKGPFATDKGFSVTLADRTTVVTGAQIIADIGEWLANGAPENG